MGPSGTSTNNNMMFFFVPQSLNQDVQAHENAIQSANTKAQELASKSPESKVISDTAQISEQYTNLQQVVKVRLRQSASHILI